VLSRLGPFLLLALSLLSVASASVAGLATRSSGASLPNVQVPLISRPASPSRPGVPPYVPSDIRTAYDFNPLYAHGINGTGTRIAIVDAYGDPRLSNDLSSFDSLTGLPSATVNIYYPDGVPAVRDSGWALETALDVEWAHAIAPAATIDLVVAYDSSLGSVYDGISYVANQLTNETVLSMSFGLSESQYPASGSYTIAATHQLFVTMTSHGTTPFASSGDDGASTCCNVSYPASDPLVVAVGGTTLNLGSGTANYAYETAWSGSGAGSSTVFAKPNWQQGIGDSMRDITDVSYDADPNTGVLVIQGGYEYEVGGTSAGSPQWAALTALASQAVGTKFGSIASKLYSLTSYHDITSGSDGYFTAGPGWNYPTGLGSPDASLLVSSLIQPPATVKDSTIIQGLNVTTTGSLSANFFTSEVTGPITVEATNSTTGTLVFAENFTILDVSLQNQTVGQVARFILSIPSNTYSLSSDITLTLQGTKYQAQATVTRRVNISGGPTVNINDVTTVIANYDLSIGNPSYDPQADLAVQGTVNINDVSIVVVYYGATVFS
jgi:subtilase family serine protease